MQSVNFNYLKDNYFRIEGRASSAEYFHFHWLVVLYLIIFLICVAVLEGSIMSLANTDIQSSARIGLYRNLITLLSVASFIPFLTLAIRRMHDLNLSGWWYFAAIAASALAQLPEWLIGAAAFLFLLIKGSEGPNKYGDESDFNRSKHRSAPYRLWESFPKYRIPMVFAVLGFAYLGFLKPIVGYEPVDRGDGYTEYRLIDHASDSEWVLALPNDLQVTRLESRGSRTPSFGGLRSSFGANQNITFDVTPSTIGLPETAGESVTVSVSAAPEKLDHKTFYWADGKYCKTGAEIAENIFELRDFTLAEAELEYENGRSRNQSVEEFYADRYVGQCLLHFQKAKYSVHDAANNKIASGACHQNTLTCKFRFWLPFERMATYTVNHKDVVHIAAIHKAVVTLLADATDQDLSRKVTLPDRNVALAERADPETYMPAPVMKDFNVTHADIPPTGFKAYYYSQDPNRRGVVMQIVETIALRDSKLKRNGIDVRQGSAYYLGKLNFAEPTAQKIGVHAGGTSVVIRINGQVVYSSFPKPITLTTEMLEQARRMPLFLSSGANPVKDFVFEFPQGDSIIEVDVANTSHSLDFKIAIQDVFEKIVRREVKERITADYLQNAAVYYYAVDESNTPDFSLDIRVPKTDGPVILVLDSNRPVDWKVNHENEIAYTIVSSGSTGTRVLGRDLGETLHLNHPLRMHSETRACSCNRGFRCRDNTDLLDIAAAVKNLTGVELSGYAIDDEASFLSITRYSSDIRTRIDVLREEEAKIRANCDV